MGLSTREADVAFADLICSDPQWLDAEFDALIAASFGEPPGAPPPAPPRVPPRPGTPLPPPPCRRLGPVLRPSITAPACRAAARPAALTPGAFLGRPPGRRSLPLIPGWRPARQLSAPGTARPPGKEEGQGTI